MRIVALADTTDIRSRLREYSSLMNKNVADSVRQFAVVACRNLANTTQPFSGREKATSEEGRLKGEGAVKVDIGKVFYVPTVDGGFTKALTQWAELSYRKKYKDASNINRKTEAFRKRMNRYVSEGNTAAIRKISRNMGWKNIHRTVDPRLHEAARTGRRKRTVKPASGMVVILNKPEHLERYVKKRQKMVGLAKAGWAKCADLIKSAKKGPATRGIPQWVTRHKRRANGSIQDLTNNARNPKVIMTNKIPWASNVITPNGTREAVDLAKRNFVEYMNRTMKGELRRQARLKGV